MRERARGALLCVLQCVAVWCNVLQCGAMCCSVMQCVAVCCSVLQCVAVCCSVLHCLAVCSVLRGASCAPHDSHTRVVCVRLQCDRLCAGMCLRADMWGGVACFRRRVWLCGCVCYCGGRAAACVLVCLWAGVAGEYGAVVCRSVVGA